MKSAKRNLRVVFERILSLWNDFSFCFSRLTNARRRLVPRLISYENRRRSALGLPRLPKPKRGDISPLLSSFEKLTDSGMPPLIHTPSFPFKVQEECRTAEVCKDTMVSSEEERGRVFLHSQGTTSCSVQSHQESTQTASCSSLPTQISHHDVDHSCRWPLPAQDIPTLPCIQRQSPSRIAGGKKQEAVCVSVIHWSDGYLISHPNNLWNVQNVPVQVFPRAVCTIFFPNRTVQICLDGPR